MALDLSGDSGNALLLTLFWVILMILILFLNLPIGFLFWSSDQLASPRNMYVASMIVSDILMALLIPFKVYWVHARMDLVTSHLWVCRGILVVQCFLVLSGAYSILALALVRHRYITTLHKDLHQTRQEAACFIVFFWVASALSAFKVSFLAHSVDKRTHECVYPSLFEPNLVIYELLMSFALPFITIFVLCDHAHRHADVRLKKANDQMEVASFKKRDTQVVRMVVLLSAVFVLLQLPDKVMPLVEYYRESQHEIAAEVCQLLSFCVGASNIVIYVSFNRRAASMILNFMKHRGSQVAAVLDLNNTSAEQSVAQHDSLQLGGHCAPRAAPTQRGGSYNRSEKDSGAAGGGATGVNAAGVNAAGVNAEGVNAARGGGGGVGGSFSVTSSTITSPRSHRSLTNKKAFTTTSTAAASLTTSIFTPSAMTTPTMFSVSAIVSHDEEALPRPSDAPRLTLSPPAVFQPKCSIKITWVENKIHLQYCGFFCDIYIRSILTSQN